MRRAAWGLLGAALAIGLVGQAGRVSDRADAVNFFAPAWLLAGFLAAIFLLAASKRLRPRLLAGAAMAVLGAIGVSLYASGESAPAPCTGDALTLVQFNILKDNPDVAPAIAWIRGTNADVVTLEEAAGELPVVAALRADYPYAVSCVAPMHCSTMILSKRPFVASGGLARGDPENRQGLSAAWATVPIGTGSFTLVATHMDRPWPWHNRPSDLAELTAFVRGQSPATTILAGDFNLPQTSFQLQRLTRNLGLARAPDIRSWPATGTLPPMLAIDHVFHGRAWSIADMARGPFLGSDHYPLLVRFCRARPA